MSHTLTIRLPPALAAWLEEESAKTGVPQGRIVREQLEKARAASEKPWMRLAGRRASQRLDTQGILEALKAIADTGFLVAFLRRDDMHHEWAVEVAKQVTDPFLTCEAVLAETAFHVQSSASVLGLVQAGMVAVSFACADHVDHLAGLARRFADRQPDLADLCVIRMSELHPHHTVITVDRENFQVYRRNKRETIPFISPPGR